MKIAIVTNFLYPEALGGTEVYCFQLANALIKNGHEVYWFVPNFKKTTTASEERGDGIKIIRFAAVDDSLVPKLDFTIASFIKEIKARNIEAAHFNEFGGDDGISSTLLGAAKNAGVATIVTLHVITSMCHTGTLHFGGKQVCNGKMILGRCTSCHLFSNKTSFPTVNLVLAQSFYNLLKIKSVRSIPKLKRFMSGMDQRSTFIKALKENADVIVSLSRSFREVLLVNGIPEKKIHLISQVSPGVVDSITSNKTEKRKHYVFFGRVHQTKGIDLLLKMASKLKQDLPGVVIDLYGPNYGSYVFKQVEGLDFAVLGKFDNIRYRGILKPEEVLPIMNNYKAVILPSLIAEMAPLIIMEANQLKVPVIVSDVPGSVELVKKYDCGVVFKYGSADDLLKRIEGVENDRYTFSFKQPVENDFYFTAKKYETIYKSYLAN